MAKKEIKSFFLTEEPEKIKGDIEELKKKLLGEKEYKKELEKTKGKSPFENVNGNSTQEENGNGHSAPITMKCPVTSVHTSSNSDAIAEKKKQGMIHKFYD